MIYSDKILALRGNPISFESIKGGWRSYVQKSYLQKFCKGDNLHLQFRVDTYFQDAIYLRIKKSTISNGKWIKDGDIISDYLFMRHSLSDGYDYIDVSVNLSSDYGIYFCEIITKTTNDYLILADSNLWSICKDYLKQESVLLKYKHSENGYNMCFDDYLQTLMTGSDLKTFSPSWTIKKDGVVPSMAFAAIDYAADGTSAEASKDKLVLSIYDESPYVKNSVHSAIISSKKLSKDYSDAVSGSLTKNAFSSDLGQRESGIFSRDLDFASAENDCFSVSGNTITAKNAGHLKITIPGGARTGVVFPATSGEYDVYVYEASGTFKIGSTNHDMDVDISNNTADIYFSDDTDDWVLELDVQEGEKIPFSYSIYAKGVYNNTNYLYNYSISEPLCSFAYEFTESVPYEISETLIFNQYSDDYFLVTTGGALSLLKAGSVHITGSYVIVLTFNGLSGSITPLAGTFYFSEEIEITTSMWSIVNNVATITIPIDVTTTSIGSASYILHQSSTNTGGTLTAASANFSFTLTEPSTEYEDGVNFKLHFIDFNGINVNGTAIAFQTLNKTSIQEDSLYKFSLDFESYFLFGSIPSGIYGFNIYEVDSKQTLNLIAQTKFYYVRYSQFYDVSTRIYNGMPFFSQNYTENWFYKRVEGGFKEHDRQFLMDYSSFSDQNSKPINIYSSPYEKKTLTLSDNFISGLPNFELSKLIAIFAFDTIYVDGIQMSRTEDDDIEIVRENTEYGFGIFKIILTPSDEYMIEQSDSNSYLVKEDYEDILDDNEINLTV